jgi:hypothetical protein
LHTTTAEVSHSAATEMSSTAATEMRAAAPAHPTAKMSTAADMHSPSAAAHSAAAEVCTATAATMPTAAEVCSATAAMATATPATPSAGTRVGRARKRDRQNNDGQRLEFCHDTLPKRPARQEAAQSTDCAL